MGTLLMMAASGGSVGASSVHSRSSCCSQSLMVAKAAVLAKVSLERQL